MASSLIGKQAVVIGAGMAGLTAAGALADHFDQVLVLERDALPSEPKHRVGTPQARHVHGLLLSGQRALSELFPGFEQDLAHAGALPLRVGFDIRVERPGYDPFPQRDLGWFGYAASRPTIEHVVRQRVENRANIELCQRCRVQEVLGSSNGAAVTGVLSVVNSTVWDATLLRCSVWFFGSTALTMIPAAPAATRSSITRCCTAAAACSGYI